MSYNPYNGVGFLLECHASLDKQEVEAWLAEQRRQPGCVGWRYWEWNSCGTGSPWEYVAQVVYLDRAPYRRPGRTFAWLTGELYELFHMEWGRSYYARWSA